MNSHRSPFQRSLIMLAIVVSGEAIFLLPFIVPRVFRPTLLAAFDITNLQLGLAFSVYGIVAMAAYFPGGPLADRFSVRKLMTTALLVTSLGGAYFATIPKLDGLRLLYAFWGLSSILLFWAALIRATRDWGGANSQGFAYGILEGGRGMFAAVLASVGTFVLVLVLPEDAANATREQKIDALQKVIWIYSLMTATAAALVWFCIPDSQDEQPTESRDRISLSKVVDVLRNPAVWLQGAIVVCAYTGYKGSDDFGLYSQDAFGFDNVQAATLSTLSLWIRPITALGAGLLADRIGASKGVLICFALLVAGDMALAMGMLDPSLPWMLYTTVIGTSAMIYGLRGIYFALFPEARVSTAFTGTAVGLVSFIGYTPDIFMGPLNGYLTDSYPGAIGHQFFFGALAVFATCGFIATVAFRSVCSRRDQSKNRAS